MIRAAGPHCVGLPLKGTKRLGPRRRNGLQAALGALSAGRPRASPPRPRGAAFQWIPMKRIRPKNSPPRTDGRPNDRRAVFLGRPWQITLRQSALRPTRRALVGLES